MAFVVKQFASDNVQVTVLDREEVKPQFLVMTIFRDQLNRGTRTREFEVEKEAIERAEDTFACYR